MRLTGKVLTILLIAVMAVNAVGIAQVSHICKMAVSGLEADKCNTIPGATHPCCKAPKTTENQSKQSEEGCCKNVIKYYHQKVNTTLQQTLKVHPLNFFISLFFVSVAIPEARVFTNFTASRVFLLPKSGKNIILDIQSFLI